MKFKLLVVLVVISLHVFSQSPKLMNYQGAARRLDGSPIANRSLGVKFEILEGAGAGAVVSSETQTVLTNVLGLFSTQIGKSGLNFAAVNWQTPPHYIQISIDTTGGITNFTGTFQNQITSIPFAFNADHVPSNYTNNVLSIGKNTYTLASAISTSITTQGILTGANVGTSFTLSVPNPILSNTANVVSISQGTASSTITVPITHSISSGGIASVTPLVGTAFTISVPAPTLSANGNTLTFTQGTVTNIVSLPAQITQSIVGAGIATISSPTSNSFVVTVNQPTFAYSQTNGSLTSGSASANITPSLTLIGSTLNVGPTSNSVNLSILAPWIQNGGTVSLTTASSNVGIGIINPTSKLAIMSNTSMPNFAQTTTLNFTPTSNLGGAAGAGYFMNSFNGTGGAQFNSAITGYLRLAGGASSSTYNTGAWLHGISQGGSHNNMMGVLGSAEVYGANIGNVYGGYFTHLANTGTVTNGYGIYVGSIYGTNKWSLYSSDATAPNFFAGMVGIGTNTPSYSLDVIGTGGIRARVYSQDGNYAGYLSKNSTREFFAGVQATYEAANGTNSGYHIYDNTAGARRMVIDYLGRMGINNSAPTATLDVAGTFKLTDGSEGAAKVLTSDASGNATWSTAAAPSRVRSIVIEPGTMNINSSYAAVPATYSMVGGWQRPCVVMPDAGITQVQLHIAIPSDWNATSSFTVRILYGSPGTSGNFGMQTLYSNIALNASAVTASSGGGFNLSQSTTVEGLSQYLDVIAVGSTSKVLHYTLRRNGSSGLDTSTDPMRLYGIAFDYRD